MSTGVRGGARQLGRLFDPAALDSSKGPRARLAITVPGAWLASPCVLEIAAPSRLSCARCGGGGCDGCKRSGCLRAPADADARAIEAPLQGGDAEGFALRLVWPFGPASDIEQLIVEVRPGECASPGVARRLPPAAMRLPARPRPPVPWRQIAVLLLVVLGLAVALSSR